jgi:rSAM/selenodomain-associated transferase 1
MSADCAVIIFAKYPQKGNVKTRLAKDRGEDFATEFYRTCAEHFFSEVLKLNNKIFTPIIFCYGKTEVEMVSGWTGKEFMVKPQIHGELGDRMSASFREIFSKDFSKAVIIGTDVPDINSNLINAAAAKLDEHDIVIGPSSDGGYYLLGMKRLLPEIFKDIEWSTSLVLQKTLDKIRLLNLTVGLLDELIDIDTEHDLNNWMNSCIDLNNPVYKFVLNYDK